MPYRRRRRVFVETSKGRRSAGFTVAPEADAADVSMELRRRGFAPYRLTLDAEQGVWIAAVMDWRRRAA
jgi:nitrogen fixation protein FixH